MVHKVLKIIIILSWFTTNKNSLCPLHTADLVSFRVSVCLAARLQREGRGHSESGGTMGPPFCLMHACCWAGQRWAWWIGEKMEEYVERGQLRGWGSPGRWWQIKQKRPHAAPQPVLSPSPLTPVMGTGSLKWVATAKCIIFEMLSHKPSWPHIQLCLMLFMSLPLQPLFAVSNCLPPASEMSCQPWTGLSFVCQGSNRLRVTTSKKKKEGKNGLKWSVQGQSLQRALY